MKRYVSHKEVEAGQIVDIHTAPGNTRWIVTAVTVRNGRGEHERIEVPADFNARGTPQMWDYLLRYKDGYVSWSPREAFEAGYRVIE